MLEKEEKGTHGVKFSQNVVLLESFLKQWNVQYTEADLEDTPLGRGHVIRQDYDKERLD